MSETLLFVLGLIAFLFAVGPLIVAAVLDVTESRRKAE